MAEATAESDMKTSAISTLARAVRKDFEISPNSALNPDEQKSPSQSWALVARPTILGFLAVVAIVLGASQPDSPFTLKQPGAWFFGINQPPIVSGSTPAPTAGLFLGLIGVYGGLFVFMRAWWVLERTTKRNPGISIKVLAVVFMLWVIPLLMAPPLFSRDSYSYAGQGEMVSQGISPYQYGVNVLGQNANPYYNQVDPLWQYTPVPYGPLDLALAGLLMNVADHKELLMIVLLRVIMGLCGIIAAGFYVPRIARILGRDPAQSFTLALLSPVVILHLIGGIHNDALMIGFMLPGLAYALGGRPVVGIVLCALAALIKAPAFVAVGFIGWNWPGSDAPPALRFKYLSYSAVIALGVMALATWPTGLGWGWVKDLNAPDAVVSWMAPVTGIGIGLSHISHAIGLPISGNTWLNFVRKFGTASSVAAAVYLLFKSHKNNWIRSLGIALILSVVLSPVVQPWYLCWGLVVLAFSVEGWQKKTCMALAVVSSFVGLPGGRQLLYQLGVANPIFVAPSVLILGIVLLGPCIPWIARVKSNFQMFQETPDSIVSSKQSTGK